MMVDLHCHVLPGVDDGPRTLADSLTMCRLAHQGGCDLLVATPHQRHPAWSNRDRARLEALVTELNQALDGKPQVLPGAEIRVDDELLAEIDLLPRGPLLPLANSRSLLLELDRFGEAGDPTDLVHELTVAGWQAIIAHPEHYGWLFDEPWRLERLAQAGALFQITAMSLTGDFGKGPQAACRSLLDLGLVHFVASDAHGINRRPPGLEAARRALVEGWGEAVAQALTEDNPRAVVERRPLPMQLPTGDL